MKSLFSFLLVSRPLSETFLWSLAVRHPISSHSYDIDFDLLNPLAILPLIRDWLADTSIELEAWRGEMAPKKEGQAVEEPLIGIWGCATAFLRGLLMIRLLDCQVILLFVCCLFVLE